MANNKANEMERLVCSGVDSFKFYVWQMNLIRTLKDKKEQMQVFESLCEYMFLGKSPSNLRKEQRIVFFRLLTAYK